LQFALETNTGLYRAGLGQAGFSILGIQILDINSAGLNITGDVETTGAGNFIGGISGGVF
jgi:hypothetical protein